MNIPQRKLLINSPSNNSSLLPPEYQQVEYLESTGTQYINTCQDSMDIVSFKLSIYPTEATVGTTIFGNENIYMYVYTNGNFVNIAGVYNGFQAYFTSWDGGFSLNQWYDIELGRGYFVLNGVKKGFAKYNKQSSQPIYLFCRNANGTPTAFTSVPMKHFQIYKGEENPVLVRDFVSCYQKTNNTGGMYDLYGETICPLTNTPFYSNAGTGEFLKGADV